MVSDDFRGALFILAGMLVFSVQDVLIRQLSDGGSLLQVLTIRGVLGALVISIFVRLTGRQLTISSSYPFLAASRVVLFFVGFLCFYFALSHMRLAEATALFFASPLFITGISKIVLKETVGIYRIAAMIIGFIGVILIVQPSLDEFDAIAIFPLFTALTYSISMMIARYTKEKDTVWQQMLHLYIGSAFFALDLEPFLSRVPKSKTPVTYLLGTSPNDSFFLSTGGKNISKSFPRFSIFSA